MDSCDVWITEFYWGKILVKGVTVNCGHLGQENQHMVCVPSEVGNSHLQHETMGTSMKREDQQDATIRCLLLTSVTTCFRHHYAHLQDNKGLVTAFGVFWFCWMWLVAVVGHCIVGCEHCRAYFWVLKR